MTHIVLVGGFDNFWKIVNGKDYPIYYVKKMFETTKQSIMTLTQNGVHQNHASTGKFSHVLTSHRFPSSSH